MTRYIINEIFDNILLSLMMLLALFVLTIVVFDSSQNRKQQ